MFIAFLLQAAAVAAPLPPERADARCLAAFGMLVNQSDETVQRAGQLGAVYFYGKLLGRNPGIDLRTAIEAAAKAVGPNAKAELTRCGSELDRAGTTMQAVGSAMAPEPALTPAPSPSPTGRPRR